MYLCVRKLTPHSYISYVIAQLPLLGIPDYEESKNNLSLKHIIIKTAAALLM